MRRLIMFLIAVALVVGGVFYYTQYTPEKEPTEQLIKRIYGGVTGKISQKERDEMEFICGEKSPVYGEILYSSLKTIIDELALDQDDVWYDLGCGTGKVIMQVALDSPIKKAVGIELSPTRAARSQLIKDRLAKEGLLPKDKVVEFRSQNMLDADLDDATAVYMCSTCYPTGLMEQITQKLAQVPAANKLRIITLKKLPDTDAFELTKEYRLPMTWSAEKGSPVYRYERKS